MEPDEKFYQMRRGWSTSSSTRTTENVKKLGTRGLIDYVETPSGHQRCAVYAYISREAARNRAKVAPTLVCTIADLPRHP